MSKHSVVELQNREVLPDLLTEMLREGSTQLIYQAVEMELAELLERHSDRRTEDGK